GANAPSIGRFNLDTRLTDYAIAELPIRLPGGLPQSTLQGRFNFAGDLVGTLAQPTVSGRVDVQNLQAGQVTFDPLLRGSVQYSNQGIDLALAGAQDQVRLELAADNTPESFLVQLDQGVIQGRRQGNALAVLLKHFPIATVQQQFLEPPYGLIWAGVASGQATIALDASSAQGTLAISNPSVGSFQAGQLRSQFTYSDGVVTLADSSLAYGDSTYDFSGRAVLNTPDPQFELAANVTDGNPQDLFQTLQWYDVADIFRGLRPPQFARAADLQLIGVGNPQAPFFNQLLRFSEIKVLTARQIAERQRQKRLPPLSELEGTFDGSVQVQGSLSEGVTASFKFEGDDWLWGEYTADDLLIQGDWRDNQLALSPISATLNDSLVSFSGIFGEEANSGQLRIAELPLELLDGFVDLPVDVSGQVNVTAALSGSAAKPQVLGQLELLDGTLNNVPVETSQTGFNYVNGRLGFGGKLSLDSPEPVEIFGSIPYALPLSQDQSTDNTISLKIDVANEGLALLNILSQDQLQWQGGQGQVSLEIGGTVQQPIASGVATFESAQIGFPFFPEPLRDLSGNILFRGGRIEVETLQGTFSEGQITANGFLPIAQPVFDPQSPDQADATTTTTQPLNVGFENVNLNLPGQYQGQTSGQVQVIGTLLQPRLTGNVDLFEGQIFIPDTTAGTVAAIAPGTEPTIGAIAPLELQDLRISLADRVEVLQPPIFQFRAEGSLLVNGGLRDLRPTGAIELTRGQVNLFTTRFGLSRRYDNQAIFTPEQGLNPDLDLRLVASVTESSNGVLPIASTTGSEIADTRGFGSDLGEIQTIQIRAQVDGPASRLLDNIELTSSPTRSEAEIYNLIGGGFVTTLGQGNNGTLALASLAGSALLNNIQVAINNAFAGPVNLRVFPVVVNPEDRRERTDRPEGADNSRSETLALGAELGINITNSLSFSVLRVLTLDIPTQFGLRYQINDNLGFRASTDFEGDDRAVLEYELRF
ncbi:MAG: translocation/assembly module TamB domain-containing protein, partial [Cyanobacteria bacterium P01_H01_bin.121]